MNKTKYKVRHISCNMSDFNADKHRFRFEYNGKEYVASCYSSVNVEFDDATRNDIPEDVLMEIQSIIWNKIDKEEKNWRYPQEAYDIADAYMDDEF